MLKKVLMLQISAMVFAMAASAFTDADIAGIESAKYGTVYENESLGERLNRLETDFFGMSQTGSIESRIENLSRINADMQRGVSFPPGGSFYNTGKKGLLRGLWDNIASGFNNSGYMTGYTPSIMNTSSMSGYLNDLGGNTRFYNNLPSFCPYDRNIYNKRLADRQFFNRRHHHPHGYFGAQNPAFNINAGVNPALYPDYRYSHPYTNRTSYYLPPNIETKSSIHILKD